MHFCSYIICILTFWSLMIATAHIINHLTSLYCRNILIDTFYNKLLLNEIDNKFKTSSNYNHNYIHFCSCNVCMLSSRSLMSVTALIKKSIKYTFFKECFGSPVYIFHFSIWNFLILSSTTHRSAYEFIMYL